MHELLDNLIDEDERDENGEDLLGEARHVAHQETPLQRDSHDRYSKHPQSNPKPEHQKLKAFILCAQLRKDILSKVKLESHEWTLESANLIIKKNF